MPAKSSIDGVVAVAAAAAVSLGPVPHAVPAGAALPGAGAAPPHVLPAGSAPEGLAAAAAAAGVFAAAAGAAQPEALAAAMAKVAGKGCGKGRVYVETRVCHLCRQPGHLRQGCPNNAEQRCKDGEDDEEAFRAMRLSADPLPVLHDDGAVHWQQRATRGQELLEPRGDFPNAEERLVQLAAAADVGDSLRFAGAGAAGSRRRRRRLAELSRKMPPASSAAAAAVADDQEQQQQPPPPPPLGETAAAPAPTAEGSEVADPVEPSSTASPGK